MTTSALKQFNEKCPFENCYQPTFFDEQKPQNKGKKEFCRVYNDGGHFVAVPLKVRRDKVQFVALREENPERKIFDELYNICQRESKNNAETREFLQNNLCHLFEEENELNGFIDSNIKRCLHNLHSRKKRARKKANLNKWSYFITITFDDKKHTEAEFRKKLRKAFCNFHTRRGWRYMGVFERAPQTGRLHFHALLYVPENQMVGNIIEKQDYSTKKHCMQTTHENSFFASAFGRNDFEELKPVMRNECIGYILKYLEKTGEKIIYSRGVPAEIYTSIDRKSVV